MSGVILAVLVLLCLVVLIAVRRREAARLMSADIAESAALLREELSVTADTVVRRLEERVARLEDLLEEADGTIAALEERLQTAREFAAALPGEPAPAAETRGNSQSSSQTTAAAAVQSAVPPTQLPVAPALSVDRPERTERPAPVPERNPERGPDDRRRQVIRLAEEGYGVTDIARIVGLGKGEIMLLLQLHKK